MRNALLDRVEYRVDETAMGTWRRFMYPSGMAFAEYESRARVMGVPVFHFTRGICPETGARKTARGIVAVGRRAVGVVAIGQFAVGLVAVGQAAIGGLLGLGQAACGLAAIGQLALGLSVGLGQVATGSVAVGQFAAGRVVLAQVGVGTAVWSPKRADPAAVEFFR